MAIFSSELRKFGGRRDGHFGQSTEVRRATFFCSQLLPRKEHRAAHTFVLCIRARQKSLVMRIQLYTPKFS